MGFIRPCHCPAGEVLGRWRGPEVTNGYRPSISEFTLKGGRIAEAGAGALPTGSGEVAGQSLRPQGNSMGSAGGNVVPVTCCCRLPLI